MNKIHEQALQYIKNIGGSPTIEWFDEDYEPIGPMLRKAMKKENLIYESNGKIYIKE